MALAEVGRCDDAAQWQRRMIADAERDKKTDFAEKLKAELPRYERGQPCRPAGQVIAPDPVMPKEKKP
jgi:hypothetical protein